ncbi:MAG TPA: hypothetical protein PLU75_04810 [Oscillospiraceae bacterium]|nr:hypothetical protein [Oscillospiraceae bacterium]HQQ90144.1 hypothetical protein [Oscillospiraceae bacterium]HRW56322.1 hypothetical protein [Oscillospiraceae bacterium]
MLSIEDQINNSTVMIKTADYIESQIHKVKSDGGAADEFSTMATDMVEKLRDMMKQYGIIR